MSKDKSKIKTLTFAALFAAIICIATSVVKIPLGGQDYAHPGDAFVLLAAVPLPTPYAMAAAGIGAALADILGGYGIWAPFTVIIKALMAFAVSRFCYNRKITKLKLFYAMAAATLINVIGYYLAGIVVYKSAVVSVSSVVGTFLQSLVGIVIFLLTYRFILKLSERY
ncbi:MAG: ECF transporter S component [Bacillota bacterium]|nr:ECF transporter S component [Bacillota bacterium]